MIKVKNIEGSSVDEACMTGRCADGVVSPEQGRYWVLVRLEVQDQRRDRCRLFVRGQGRLKALRSLCKIDRQASISSL